MRREFKHASVEFITCNTRHPQGAQVSTEAVDRIPLSIERGGG
jgi:hypothetical protein